MENTNNTNEFFAKKLRDLMKAKSFSQKTLAKRLESQQSTVSAWKTGKVLPSVANLDRLCKIFDTNPNAMLGYEVKAPVGYISKDAVMKMKKDYDEKIKSLESNSEHKVIIDEIKKFCLEGIEYAEKSMKKFCFFKKNREINEQWQMIKEAYSKVLELTEKEAS